MSNENYINLITGDVHENTQKFITFTCREFLNLKPTDKIRLFITGDFGLDFHGGYTEKDILFRKTINNLAMEIFSVIGNHENRDVIDNYPIIYKNGGKMLQADERIFYLMNGEIYTFTDEHGKPFKLFAFGGGFSTDRTKRIEHEKQTGECIFWEKELPSEAEYEYARTKLKEVSNNVDIILSHTSPMELKKKIIQYFRVPGKNSYDDEHDLNQFLEEILNSVTFKKWYFGHFHCDAVMTPDEKMYVVYENIRFMTTGEMVDKRL